jgi:hypothetical protein
MTAFNKIDISDILSKAEKFEGDIPMTDRGDTSEYLKFAQVFLKSADQKQRIPCGKENVNKVYSGFSRAISKHDLKMNVLGKYMEGAVYLIKGGV